LSLKRHVSTSTFDHDDHDHDHYYQYSRADSLLSSCESMRFPLLCNIKLLVPTLALDGLSRFGFSIHDHLSELIAELTGANQILADHFKDITPAHLLSHTHGLPDVEYDTAVLTSNGFIDINTLLGNLRSKARLFLAGRYYSYGMTGYILLGVLLERIYQMPFHQVLGNQLLNHLWCANGVRNPVQGLNSVCPASGNGLKLAFHDLVSYINLFAFANQHHQVVTASFVNELLDPRIVMPGWSPFIVSSCYGWKYFGAGWYGHNGVADTSVSYVRVNPERRISVCIAAEGQGPACGMLPFHLLHQKFPELLKPINAYPAIDPDASLSESHRILGCFNASSHSYHIFLMAKVLRLQIFSLHHSVTREILHETDLYPAADDLFYLSRPWRKIFFVQLVCDEETNDYFIWDHVQLLPRLKDRLGNTL
jgi:hypothetical protein